MSNETRPLTPNESSIIKLLQSLEVFTNQRKLVARVTVTTKALELIKSTTPIKFLTIEYDVKADQWICAMTVQEFMLYIHYVIRLTGLTLMLDGSLKTSDNLVISNEYLGVL